jgi:hypothetical protein
MEEKIKSLLKRRQLKDVINDKRTINELNEPFVLDFNSSFKEEMIQSGISNLKAKDFIYSTRGYRLSNHYQGFNGEHFWNFAIDVIFTDGSSVVIESYQNNYKTVLEYFPEFKEISERMAR